MLLETPMKPTRVTKVKATQNSTGKPPVPFKSAGETHLERERERKKNYYHNHKEKLAETTKLAHVAKMTIECEARGIPVFCAEHIKIYKATETRKERIGLKFDTDEKLIGFLIDVKAMTSVTERDLIELRSKMLPDTTQ